MSARRSTIAFTYLVVVNPLKPPVPAATTLDFIASLIASRPAQWQHYTCMRETGTGQFPRKHDYVLIRRQKWSKIAI